MLTDDYPDETYWELLDESKGGTLYASYDDGFAYTATATWHEHAYNFVNGNYALRMYDVRSDGLCCDYGEGEYQLYVGGQLVRRSQFIDATLEETRFTVPLSPPPPSLSPSSPRESATEDASPAASPPSSPSSSPPPNASRSAANRV